MRFTIFQDSKVGDRDGNEDRVGDSFTKDVLLMVIADGMGGHHGGEIASEITVQEITQRFRQEAQTKLKRPFEFCELPALCQPRHTRRWGRFHDIFVGFRASQCGSQEREATIRGLHFRGGRS